MLTLSSTPKSPAMIIWGLISLLLFTATCGTPIGDQDEDIQVEENFQAERVMTACGQKGWDKVSFIFLQKEGQ